MASIARAALLAGLLMAVLASPAGATPAGIGFSDLNYVCPNTGTIDFSWTPVGGAQFYSLQLTGPTDPSLNGGIGGTYLRQFGAIEIFNGTTTNASLNANVGALPAGTALQFQVMLGVRGSYSGIVPLQQVVSVPMPCTAVTTAVSLAGT